MNAAGVGRRGEAAQVEPQTRLTAAESGSQQPKEVSIQQPAQKFVRFTHMHSGGRAAGVIHADTPTPKQVYADNAIPEEEAEVEMLRRQRGFRQAVVHHLLKPSPDRVAPFCPHAGICGGCNWQHLAYPAQLYWKRQILIDALVKYGIDTPPVPDVVPSPLLQGYRNKSEYAFSSVPEPVFGFHPKEDRSRVFACKTCFLQPQHVHPIVQHVFRLAKELRLPFYRYADRTGLLQSLQVRTTTLGDTFCIVGFSGHDPSAAMQDAVHLFLDRLSQEISIVNGWSYHISDPKQESSSFYPDFIHFNGASFIREKIESLSYRFSPHSFFQPNPLQAAALYRQVKNYAGLNGSETVYDLYTGIGSIACYIANGAKEVIGIEGNPAAVRDAVENAKLNGISNARFITGDILETFKPDFIDLHPQADLVILDPPRSGTLTEIKKAMLYASPSKIIYVSCNPVSLAWDLKQLCVGGYRVTAIQPFDMFPHTHHVETVCLLTRIFCT